MIFIYMEFKTTIEKFMDRMGITYSIDTHKRFNLGRSICVEIIAYYQKKPQYEIFHCYTLNRNNGKVSYDESNFKTSVSDGIFAYLGDNLSVDEYFSEIARQYAIEYFKKLEDYYQ